METQLLEKLRWRYACKKFDASKKLSPQKLQLLKEAFNLTATSYGLQPLKMIVIGDEELKAQLVQHSMNQLQVRDASHLLVICIESELNDGYIKDHFQRVEGIRNTPRTILEPYEKALIHSFAQKKDEEIRHWMINQAYLALGNMLTVCAVEDIDACPMEGFEPEHYDRILGLQENTGFEIGFGTSRVDIEQMTTFLLPLKST
ncbi:MAG: NAD(P)H-dependent oxidoreductase [Flavobacteriaceae bacterium]